MERASNFSDAEVGYPLMVCYDPCPLPPFREQQPEAWFLHVEAQFTFAKVSSQQTRFYYLVAALPREIALELFHVLSSPPTEDPYDALKTAVLELLVPRCDAPTAEVPADQQLLADTHTGGAKEHQLPPTRSATSEDLAGGTMMTATVSTTSNRSDCCRPPRHPSTPIISTAAGPIFPADATSQGVSIPSFHPVSSRDRHSPDPAQTFPPCASSKVTMAQDPFKGRGKAMLVKHPPAAQTQPNEA